MRSEDTDEVIVFDERLRARLTTNLSAHSRVEEPLERRRHAAVAIVILGSDAVRDGEEPLSDADLSAFVGVLPDDAGPRLDGRMIGLAGGAALVLCRRPLTMRRHAGQWALPGGRIEPGESPLDAALRELREELDVHLDRHSAVGWLDDYITRSGFVITPVVLWGDADVPLTPDPTEVLAVYRIGLHSLLRCTPRFIPTPDSDRLVLQLPLGNDLIHAPTGAILYQFREVALRGRAGMRVNDLDEPAFAWR
jgi:8-oxo-dGTP pyrophosphatase MutT (NUDIX family)